MEKKLHEVLRECANFGCDSIQTAMDEIGEQHPGDLLMRIADEIERNYTPKRTCFEAIKDMSFEELGEFIFRVYNKGWHDRGMNVDDEAVFCCTMLDYPDTFLDEDWNEEE